MVQGTFVVGVGATYELHLQIGAEVELLDRVTRNELDMAVVAAEVSTADLRSTPVAGDQLIAVASPDSSEPARLEAGQLARES